MAKNQTKRLAPVKLEADENGFAALKKISDYSPINSDYALAALATTRKELHELRSAAKSAAAAAATARAAMVAKEWEFHNLMLGVKEQVIAQFGKDSEKVQLLGLKRKSDYKPPKRRARTEEKS